MKVIFLIIAFIFITLWQVPVLLKGKSYKELVAFSVLLLLSFTLALIQVLGVKLFNPSKLIEFLVHQITSTRFDYQPF